MPPRINFERPAFAWRKARPLDLIARAVHRRAGSPPGGGGWERLLRRNTGRRRGRALRRVASLPRGQCSIKKQGGKASALVMAGQEGSFCLPELFVEDGRGGGNDDALRQRLFSLLPAADEAR
eukprot:10826620-Alexandrium_andersonii.AAC.1